MLVIDLRRLLLEITRSRVSSFGRSGVNASSAESHAVGEDGQPV